MLSSASAIQTAVYPCHLFLHIQHMSAVGEQCSVSARAHYTDGETCIRESETWSGSVETESLSLETPVSLHLFIYVNHMKVQLVR